MPPHPVRLTSVMRGLDALAGLSRIPSRAPARIGAGLRHVSRGALDNARRAVAEITASVDERRTLNEGLAVASAPGDLAQLSVAECYALLASRSVGRLAYVARAGVPDIVPVNYLLDGECILVRSAPGPKLQAADRGDRVAFEVDQFDESSRTGWSVVVVGVASRVRLEDRLGAAEPAPWAKGNRRHVLRIEVTRITGRQIL